MKTLNSCYWTRKRKANIENTTNTKHVSHEKYQQPMRDLMDESKIYNENVRSQDIFTAVWKCLEIGFFFLYVLDVKRFTQFLITKHKLLTEKRQWEKKTTQKQSRESVIKLSKKNDFIASTISWNEAKILLKYLHIMRPSWNSNWCKINNNVVISVSEPFS